MEKCAQLRITDEDLKNPMLVLSQDVSKSELEIDKYDYMVPIELLQEAYLHNQMDVSAAVGILQQLPFHYR